MRDGFRRFANTILELAGTSPAFLLAVGICLAWALTGPVFHYSDTWQLVIGTITNILTLFMVFLIQHSQNRDTKAIQLKLDELLRGVQGARTHLVHLEDLTDDQLEQLQQEFQHLREHEHRQARANGAGRGAPWPRHEEVG